MSERRSGLRRMVALPRTIRGLAIGFAILSAFVTMLLGQITYRVVHAELERQVDERIEVETRALLEYDRGHGFDALVAVVGERDNDSSAYVPGLDPANGRTMGYIVLDRFGRRRAGALRASMPQAGYSEFVHFIRPDGTKGIAQGMNSPLPDGGRLLVTVDRAVIRRMDANLFRLFTVAYGSLLVIGVVLTIGLGRIMGNRLLAFERLATAVSAGDIGQRMPLDGSGVEFDRLAIVLNGMLDRISLLVVNLREVSTGLAHDLRTPLTRIRARIERAEAESRDAEQRALLDASIDDMDELLDLFGSLLAIAELDGQNVRSRFVVVDLADTVLEIAEAHRPAIEDGGRRLEVRVEPATVLGNRALLQRLLANLLDNAMVHTPVGTMISVGLTVDGRRGAIRVADDGPGVPTAERCRIFERLVRLDASRSRPGHGLGLSMVSSISAAHAGTVQVVPTDQGLGIEICLPLHDGSSKTSSDRSFGGGPIQFSTLSQDWNTPGCVRSSGTNRS